jgi:hypothetical protein
MDRTVTFIEEEISGHEPQTGPDTKMDRLTVSYNVTLTLTLTLASVTATLTSREHGSSESNPPEIASAHQASRCSSSSSSVAGQPVSPSLAQSSRCGRSFPGQPASPLSLALASCCYMSFARHPAGTPARITGYHKEDCQRLTQASRPRRELRSASDKRPFSGPAISPLAQASRYERSFVSIHSAGTLSFPVHLYILLPVISICYSFTCLSLRTTGFDIPHVVSCTGHDTLYT